MNEANLEVAERDSEADMPTAMSDVPDDRLLTTRLPPITPPPLRPPSVPPAAEASASYPPAQSYGPPSGTYRGNVSIPPQSPGSSWWKALLTATFPPPSDQPSLPLPADERVVRRRIGATCAGMAVGFVILALGLGLRGVEPAYSPVVAAAVVISRAMISLGFLAFGATLFRMAERFFTGRPDVPPSPSKLH